MTADNIEKNESISRVFWRFAIPSVAAMLINGLYQIIDGIFVGHYVGYSGLAGINMAWPIIATIMGFGILVGMGAGSLISMYRGEKQLDKASSVLQAAIGLCILFSLISMPIVALWGRDLLLLQGASGDSLIHGYDYIKVFVYSAPAAIFSAAIPMLVRNDNSPKIATVLTIIGAVLNIALDYLYLGILEQGLQGAAIATALSQLIVIMLGFAYFLSNKAEIRLTGLSLNINKTIRTCQLGASSMLMFAYFSFVVALHNRLLMEYGSEIHVGAFAIIGYIATLYYLFAEGIASGMQPPISYDFGERRYHRIKGTLLLALKVVLISGLVTVALLNLFPEFFISWFSDSNTQLMATTTLGMRLHTSALFLDGVLFLASVYFMSVGKAGKAIFVSIGNMVVQIPFLFFVPQWLGVNGVWLAVPMSNIVLTIIVLPMLYKDVTALMNKEITMTKSLVTSS
ncbi:MATE family efflux transporter [Vibrio sp. UCD-FRSSP16_10]|uniref:MATE family efflux transporter n=1 Tax=unclassified Vibrio TaxID=2614977 RepID=UPI0007FB95AA|nr:MULTISPECIES: MATE family efflux transporter [unclassified Vibrio]OBT16791.1 MATE family efflux transporter [Vibrio sp. UCD-FRSSP16_30]OBT21418.1 MATE family efflux transporter [Vibrio sp. UCD-FRSSP16_10]